VIIGKNLGDYRILAKTRLGESGTIYKALHTQQRRTYGLRLLTGAPDGKNLAQSLFLEKLKIIQGLDHSYIACIFPSESCGDYTIIPQEFVYGQPLSEKISEGPSTFDFILKVALQATEALIWAHEKGIVHEWLTSNNIIVAPEGQIKIVDFGMRYLPEELQMIETEDDIYTAYYCQPTKPPLSKFAYLAPEQVRGKPANERSDLFSLGVILYELWLGDFLFLGESVEDLYRQILARDLPKLSRIRPETASNWSKILNALLDKDPTERYPSALALLSDLQRVREGFYIDQPGFRMHNRPITRRSFFRLFVRDQD
jgi:eukaryotic-like serine/threonine-protein kinase